MKKPKGRPQELGRRGLGLGRSIRRLRLRRELTQEVLSEMAGIHNTYLGAIERGLQLPRLLTLSRIAAALQVDLADLLEA